MKPNMFRSILLEWLLLGHLLAAETIPAAPPSAGKDSPAKEAIAAYRDGRHHAAAEMARPLAASGDRDALFLMAFSLESLREPARLSRGQAMDYYYRRAEAAGHPEAALRRKLILLASAIEKERKEGLATLEAAAGDGNARALRVLGEAWLRGLVDGKPDPAKAVRHWTEAAAAGDAESLMLLGQLHDGSFMSKEPKDPAAAAGYYRRAAELGNGDAYLPLAALLFNGNEGTRDETQGSRWAKAAIENGEPRGWLILGDHQAAITNNPVGALDFYRKGAEAGQSDCMLRIASHLQKDAGTAEESFAWLVKAADRGNPAAAAELGHRMLSDGSDTPTAMRYLLVAANEGRPEAQRDLGLAYLEGKACPRDPAAAVVWLTEAMKSGDAETQYRLALLHEQGIGGPVNYANAGVLYTLACNKGHAAAATRIATMAAEGLGTKSSPVQAWAHASLAIERGDHSARGLLAMLDGQLDPAAKAEAAKVLSNLRAMEKSKPAPGQK